MPSSFFNREQKANANARSNGDTAFPLWTSVAEVRGKFREGTRIMVAIGGWGDTEGFEEAAGTEEGRERWAGNVGGMVEESGADGVDIDWEYPGGNGEDYKRIPNSSHAWEISAYPLLLSSLRRALGPHKLISAAVPGLPRDMLAFTSTTIPLIDASLDFWNIMTYDLMNRRDNVTSHHTGIAASQVALDAYLARGVPSRKANLGLAFYVKWFRTRACGEKKVGYGGGSGGAGAFSWDDEVPGALADSFARALREGMWDEEGGGWYYWDVRERLWWTWDTEVVIGKKVPGVLRERDLGGVFAWGLGEDGPRWERLEALTKGYREWKGSAKDEL
ncbi:Endochitinase [Lachnellula occidentalis]|uniref:chitinase n=1 Tax=Lachnellula occidentalis TaxID=215460 RepID=A0A8H8S4L6_9HELO|nr:Endochitinase [Lachnellula occidentalis]